MPNNVVVSFAKKTGKSEEEIESLWDDTKKIVKNEYPDVEEDNDKFFQLITGILKKRLKLETVTVMHSLKFPKETFTLSEAKSWIKLNDFDFIGINRHENSYEFVLNDTEQFETFETKELREDVEVVMGEAATVTGDIAINPSPQLKKVEPDSEHLGLPCFHVDSNDYFGGSVARRSGQRYAFANEKVRAFLRQSGYRKPFLVKYENNFLRVK